jgi:6-phosphogluconolactonase
MTDIRVYQDSNALAQAAAELIIHQAAAARAARGRFDIALSGGSTPRKTFELLADKEHSLRINWMATNVFWGDERCVPPDHPESNYRMARQVLLDHVPLPAEQIYRMQGELTPATAADHYEQILQSHFADGSGSSNQAILDLVLLGLGEDGHTASLFPGTAALQEKDRLVVANYVPQMDKWRLTLTYPCINAARNVAFLVSGAAKAGILQQVIGGRGSPKLLPSQLVAPAHGKLIWLVDEAAAAGL